jgi:hypothetical protein
MLFFRILKKFILLKTINMKRLYTKQEEKPLSRSNKNHQAKKSEILDIAEDLL